MTTPNKRTPNPSSHNDKVQRAADCTSELDHAVNTTLIKYECNIIYSVQLKDGTWVNLANFYDKCRLTVVPK